VSNRWRLVWSLMGLLVLVVVVLAILWYVLGAGDRGAASTLVSGIAAVLVPAGSVAVWLWARRQSAREASGSLLDRAADLLAEQVRVQWSNAAAERRLMQPTPIPVRWRWSNLPVTGPLLDAVGDGTGWHRFAPLPGLPAVGATALRQGGGLRDLLGIYGGLDSGRMMILGAAGAGKTGAAIRLLLDALAHRATRPGTQRPGVPVPVMLTFHGWDPIAQPLVQWLAGRLSDDYPFLKTCEFYPHAAAQLVGTGRVSVILDGLDEMPEDLRPVALRALDEQATFRVVLLTRSHEMVTAAAKGHLSGAAALELEPIPNEDTATYLARCQIEPLSPPWQRVVACIQDHPDSAVAQALDSPLMLTLVRDTYQPADRVDELLDTDRFGNRETIEDHLLDRVLPAAYAARPGQPSSRYTLAQARQWLGFIAHKMNQDTNSRDLAWWLIPGWKSAWPRVAVTGLVAGLAAGFVLGLTTVFKVGLMAGPMFGLTFGLTFGLKVSPPNQIGRLNLRRGFTRKNCLFGLVHGLVGILVGGLLGGLAVGLVIGLMGMLVGIFVGVLAYPAAHADSPIDPTTCWRRDRWCGLVVGLVAGLVAGLMVGLMTTLVVGLMIGLVIGLVAGLISSVTWPTALTFGQLRYSKEGPFRVLRFLEDAQSRHVLRTAGPRYQFRHGRLQQRLARAFEEDLSARSGHHHSTGPPHDTFVNVR
jgi:hypothetical protein